MNYKHNTIEAIFQAKFSNKTNPFTPTVLSYTQNDKYLFELSKGNAMMSDDEVFGVTVIEKENKEHRHDLSELFFSQKEAQKYIKNLK